MDHSYEALNQEYDKIGRLTWAERDFCSEFLESSRSLFTPTSLSLKTPEPKELEVFALVSGLEFSIQLQNLVLQIQFEIDQIIGLTTRYWVKPKNLGVEYCVFKWPTDNWDSARTEVVLEVLRKTQFEKFNLVIGGIQINRDGCVILKGFDENKSLSNLRGNLRGQVNFLPKKQSNWAHVPIGRILDPIGGCNFDALRDYISRHNTEYIHTELINDAKFVHERQWYMEKRDILMRIS